MSDLKRPILPFTAIVNLENLKLALVLNGVYPGIGGVLVSGPKGTGKTTVVRALADLLPEVEVVEDCRFGCNPSQEDLLCEECRSKKDANKQFKVKKRKMRVVNLPLSTTEDRLIGSLDIERVLQDGIQALKPGILAEAHQNCLYVDEVNLLPDHLVDDLLDAAATKINVIEREGISVSHPSDFVLIGTMNPEEGELRPQLLDRFPLHVSVGNPLTIDERMELVRKNLEFEQDPDAFREKWDEKQSMLRMKIVQAKEILSEVILSNSNLRAIAMACDALEVDGVRPDIIISKTAIANAALEGRKEVSLDDMKLAAQLTLSHRTRRGGLLEPSSSDEIDQALIKAVSVSKKKDRRKSPTDAPESDDKSGPRLSGGKFGRQSTYAASENKEGSKKKTNRVRNPYGNPIKGTICAVMMMIIFIFIGWIFLSPVNFLFNIPLGTWPPFHLILINTILFIPLIYTTIRFWLRNMMRRKTGPAAGIDVVEPGEAVVEPGDEWGPATRPYDFSSKSKIAGSKSEIREAPYAIDSKFFVKLPDIDAGEELFDLGELKSRALVHSKVSTGGWIKKATRSRAVGSLKGSNSIQQGRHVRPRIPHGEISSVHIPSTVMAAVARVRSFPSDRSIGIKFEDIRESVFTAKTPLTIIIVIDVSLSMKSCMSNVRQLLSRIERETRGSKDRIGIVAFKDAGAIEVQAPTTNWNKLYRALGRLKISGLTPLAEGIRKALETVKRARMRNENVEPLLIIVSDFAPNIPLVQSAGPGHARYTPVRDLVKSARLVRKANIRLAAINVNPEEKQWTSLLKRPYHEALELATHLRMRKEGYTSPVETILAAPEFRRSFGAYLIARASGGRAYLSKELFQEDSVIGTILRFSQRRGKLRLEELKEAEAYLT